MIVNGDNAHAKVQLFCMTLRSFLKGLSGELQSTLAKKVLLDANVYEDINNVTLPTKLMGQARIFFKVRAQLAVSATFTMNAAPVLGPVLFSTRAK